MTSARPAVGRTTATTVEIDGREVLSFAGCNYLGLAHHPAVVSALHAALDEVGISASASRQTTGTNLEHEELERDLARFLRTEDALLVSDGYMTNLVAAQAIVTEGSRVVVDAECHVSIRDAIAAVGAAPIEYAHADARSAASIVERNADHRIVLFTDGVYPTRGTIAPIRELLRALPANGVLVVDDCHATGVLGETGRGTCEHSGVEDERVVVASTLSKAIGCHGGFVAATRSTIEAIRTRSRAFAGSTPVPPAIARAGRASLHELATDPGRIERLRRNIARMRKHFVKHALRVSDATLPVFAFSLATDAQMQRLERALLNEGFLVPCVRYPDQPQPYVRLMVSSEHSSDDIDELAAALGRSLAEIRTT